MYSAPLAIFCNYANPVCTRRGEFGEEIFGLNSTYFAGHAPKSVNFHWRRFRIADIPLDNQEEFEVWLRNEWYKKDELMEAYLNDGRFPEIGRAHV